MPWRFVSMVPKVFAIMSLDAGGRTGASTGLFRTRPTARATIKRAMRLETIRTAQFEEPYDVQAHRIAYTWREFKYRSLQCGIPLGSVFLVIEDFHLRTGLADLSTVEVVAGLRTLQRPFVIDGQHDDVEPGCLYRPSASDAKGYATSKRLVEWGFGREQYGVISREGDHKKDACRLLCFGVKLVLDGKLPTQV
jgi:hypothetical protein